MDLGNDRHSFHTYVKVLIGAIVYKQGKIGIGELMQKSDEALTLAERSKEQVKTIILKLPRENAKKKKR